ncbi:hypothetical protein GE107_14075 [Cohnella sp. CFH 77786]|uniref:hypothetical protein n=1 Tax=Cohnella sp. CFH 77786 TaxID=2662265 RepID=UPI001C60B811|nr:hypothetical protein [Cohnella sp. CFH 77786]MBW5447182.1 hypothetical protein [Cohnella sp. CFH 77786]
MKGYRVIILLSTILLVSCTSTNEAAKEENHSNPPTNSASMVKNSSETNPNDFAIIVKGKEISLRELNSQVDLEGLLGKPIAESVQTLQGDGFTGSLLKKITYDGLEMELFSPKENENIFWIMTMVISKRNYQTTKGIQIGSTLNQITDAYPGVKIAADGRTDPSNCAYEFVNEEKYNHLLFEVENGVVAQIKIFHLIP